MPIGTKNVGGSVKMMNPEDEIIKQEMKNQETCISSSISV